MSNQLEIICQTKFQHIAAKKALLPEAILREKISALAPTKSFLDALEKNISTNKTALIAEVKKASPSRGLIRADFDPLLIAKSYEKAGAACISVLTDEPFFQGHDEHLSTVSSSVNIPVLRKDFMLDPYQVFESRALGADAILVILAALSDDQAQEICLTANSLNLSILLEIHAESELERALKLPSKLLGINHRNLKTMEIDLSLAKTLKPLIPASHIIVAESGIQTNQDIQNFHKIGINCFLVGESLMKKPNIELATKELLGIL
jgi:indole-3-glycerol phosphate synthase